MDKRLEVRMDGETLAELRRHLATLPARLSLSEWARAELLAAMHRQQHSARLALERAQFDRDLAAWNTRPELWPARRPDNARTNRAEQPADDAASTKCEDNRR
jgi:phage shock protein A